MIKKTTFPYVLPVFVRVCVCGGRMFLYMHVYSYINTNIDLIYFETNKQNRNYYHDMDLMVCDKLEKVCFFLSVYNHRVDMLQFLHTINLYPYQ